MAFAKEEGRNAAPLKNDLAIISAGYIFAKGMGKKCD
jgi:hypothetical protein